MGQCYSTPLTSGDYQPQWQQQNALAEGMARKKQEQNKTGRSNYKTTADVGLNKGDNQYVFLHDKIAPLQLDVIDEDASLAYAPSPAKQQNANNNPPSTTPRATILLQAPSPSKPKHWTKGELIGQGAFGSVYLGMDTENGHLMAVKQVTLGANITSKKVAEHIKAVEAEVEMLQNLDNPNIVRYLGTERTEDALNIFLEYVPGGSIASLLSKFGSFKESVVKVYTKQILLGLDYLHNNGIMHRDIKGANILVDNTGLVKLADFGASKKIENLCTIDSGFKSVKGTPYWMAPEVIKQSGHGRQADIWSVACTVIEMATGKPPWTEFGSQVSAMFHIASAKGPPAIPEHLSADCKDFLYLCFNRNWKERPPASRLLQHPFLAGVAVRTVAAPYNNLAVGKDSVTIPGAVMMNLNNNANNVIASDGLPILTTTTGSGGNPAVAVGGSEPARIPAWRENGRGGLNAAEEDGSSGVVAPRTVVSTPERPRIASSSGLYANTTSQQQQQGNGMSPLGAHLASSSSGPAITPVGGIKRPPPSSSHRRHSDFQAAINAAATTASNKNNAANTSNMGQGPILSASPQRAAAHRDRMNGDGRVTPARGVRASAPAAAFAGFAAASGGRIMMDQHQLQQYPVNRIEEGDEAVVNIGSENSNTNSPLTPVFGMGTKKESSKNRRHNSSSICPPNDNTLQQQQQQQASFDVLRRQNSAQPSGISSDMPATLMIEPSSTNVVNTAPGRSLQSTQHGGAGNCGGAASARASLASTAQIESARTSINSQTTSGASGRSGFNPMEEPMGEAGCRSWADNSSHGSGKESLVSTPPEATQSESPSEASSVPRGAAHIHRHNSIPRGGGTRSSNSIRRSDGSHNNKSSMNRASLLTKSGTSSSISGGGTASTSNSSGAASGPIVYTIETDDIDALPWDEPRASDSNGGNNDLARTSHQSGRMVVQRSRCSSVVNTTRSNDMKNEEDDDVDQQQAMILEALNRQVNHDLRASMALFKQQQKVEQQPPPPAVSVLPSACSLSNSAASAQSSQENLGGGAIIDKNGNTKGNIRESIPITASTTPNVGGSTNISRIPSPRKPTTTTRPPTTHAAYTAAASQQQSITKRGSFSPSKLPAVPPSPSSQVLPPVASLSPNKHLPPSGTARRGIGFNSSSAKSVDVRGLGGGTNGVVMTPGGYASAHQAKQVRKSMPATAVVGSMTPGRKISSAGASTPGYASQSSSPRKVAGGGTTMMMTPGKRSSNVGVSSSSAGAGQRRQSSPVKRPFI